MRELGAGRKTGHWIWWVFPVLAGLRSSRTAVFYALEDPAAARDYLREPVLRARLLEAVSVVHRQVVAGATIERLMGSRLDAQKLVSSLTLFAAAATRCAREGDGSTGDLETLSTRARAVLDEALRQRLAPCVLTERALAAELPSPPTPLPDWERGAGK